MVLVLSPPHKFNWLRSCRGTDYSYIEVMVMLQIVSFEGSITYYFNLNYIMYNCIGRYKLSILNF